MTDKTPCPCCLIRANHTLGRVRSADEVELELTLHSLLDNGHYAKARLVQDELNQRHAHYGKADPADLARGVA